MNPKSLKIVELEARWADKFLAIFLGYDFVLLSIFAIAIDGGQNQNRRHEQLARNGQKIGNQLRILRSVVVAVVVVVVVVVVVIVVVVDVAFVVALAGFASFRQHEI